MWLCVDRTEAGTVILISDEEQIYQLPTDEYVRLTGYSPAESTMLKAEIRDGRILSAVCDEEETRARQKAAAARLSRLFGEE